MPLLDRCIFNPVGAGTADFQEANAVQGYQTMEAAGAVDGDIYSYAAQSSDLTQWEVGVGTYVSATKTLQRTAVQFTSSGTTVKINFTSTPLQVMLTALASDFPSSPNAFGNNPTTTSGLTYGYFGGVTITYQGIDFGFGIISGGTVVLIPNATNYVQLSQESGTAVTSLVGVFPGGPYPMAIVTTSGSGIISIVDIRPAQQLSTSDFATILEQSSGLTYAYDAAILNTVNGPVSVVDGSVLLTDNATNYIEVSAAGTVTTNVSAFTSGRYPIAIVTTSAGVVTTISDYRPQSAVLPSGGLNKSTIRISRSQILNATTTPILVIPAQGPNTLIQLFNTAYIYFFGTSPYVGGDQLGSGLHFGSNLAITADSGDALLPTLSVSQFNYSVPTEPLVSGQLHNQINAPIYWGNVNTPYTGGDGTMILTAFWSSVPTV